MSRLRYWLLPLLPLAAVWMYAVSRSAQQVFSLLDRPVQHASIELEARPPGLSEASPAGESQSGDDREHSRSAAASTQLDAWVTDETQNAVDSEQIGDYDILPLLDEYLIETSGQETQEVLEAIAEFIRPEN